VGGGEEGNGKKLSRKKRAHKRVEGTVLAAPISPPLLNWPTERGGKNTRKNHNPYASWQLRSPTVFTSCLAYTAAQEGKGGKKGEKPHREKKEGKGGVDLQFRTSISFIFNSPPQEKGEGKGKKSTKKGGEGGKGGTNGNAISFIFTIHQSLRRAL